MGRGVSAGGGQSSLGYLFGGGETTITPTPQAAKTRGEGSNNGTPKQSAAASQPDRPSTKVHAAPGGGSSLGYLFGGDGK
ncbi:hypothetical protein C3L33_01461, partial [Rhododendron williamsianum]